MIPMFGVQGSRLVVQALLRVSIFNSSVFFSETFWVRVSVSSIPPCCSWSRARTCSKLRFHGVYLEASGRARKMERFWSLYFTIFFRQDRLHGETRVFVVLICFSASSRVAGENPGLSEQAQSFITGILCCSNCTFLSLIKILTDSIKLFVSTFRDYLLPSSGEV